MLSALKIAALAVSIHDNNLVLQFNVMEVCVTSNIPRSSASCCPCRTCIKDTIIMKITIRSRDKLIADFWTDWLNMKLCTLA